MDAEEEDPSVSGFATQARGGPLEQKGSMADGSRKYTWRHTLISIIIILVLVKSYILLTY